MHGCVCLCVCLCSLAGLARLIGMARPQAFNNTAAAATSALGKVIDASKAPPDKVYGCYAADLTLLGTPLTSKSSLGHPKFGFVGVVANLCQVMKLTRLP